MTRPCGHKVFSPYGQITIGYPWWFPCENDRLSWRVFHIASVLYWRVHTIKSIKIPIQPGVWPTHLIWNPKKSYKISEGFDPCSRPWLWDRPWTDTSTYAHNLDGGFHSHGGFFKFAGWFISWKIPLKWVINGVPPFQETSIWILSHQSVDLPTKAKFSNASWIRTKVDRKGVS